MSPQPKTQTIHLIGPRSSGKTTYLATLAYFPQKKRLNHKFPGFEVSYDKGSKMENLARMAADIVKKGAKLAGTPRQKVEHIPYYDFRIKIPAIKGTPTTNLEINLRDIAGEIFEDISVEHKWLKVEPYIEDLFTAQSWLIMLTDWQPYQDTRLYLPAFEKLYQEISEQEQVKPVIKKLRLAIVMSKCERGEIWTGRLEPEEDLFKVRLPKTYEFLTNKFPAHTNRLKFFACSSFGVLSEYKDDFDPRPNRYIPDDGSSAEYSAFLRSPSQWQPYGLISPIYWLTTGKTFYDSRI
ncbi:MAG: hypothetical protein WBB28_04200 [Crinalium sp.]